MTDFFKNNPIALRHCLLYEYLRKSRVERVLDAFSMVFGDNVVNKEELHSWFTQFEQGIIDTDDVEEPITDMRDFLCNDKHAIRVCILYESLKYKLAGIGYSNLIDSKIELCPSFFMYNNFCEVLGYNVMKYSEFDFWFYRFLNGEFDLKYEREEDEEIRELTDMPVDIMENIVKYLDIFDRMKLAKTSRSLQTFVEDQKLFHHTLKLDVCCYRAIFSFDESVYIHYNRKKTGCVKYFDGRVKLLEGVSHLKLAFQDLRSLFKNPKLHLDTLEIDFPSDDVSNDFNDALKFTHHLNVKNLNLVEYSWDHLVKVLPMLKPGYLKTIYVDSYDPNVDSMNKVFEMEQWKRAKYLCMNAHSFNWRLRHLFHFDEFYVYSEQLLEEDVRQMKEILFKSPDFKECSLDFSRIIDVSFFEQEFGNSLREDPYIYYYPVPNSTDYFEINVEVWITLFDIEGSSIKITRKKV